MSMAFEEAISRGCRNEGHVHPSTICFHAFSDLSHVSPATFVYLLKECYLCGTRKATSKFWVLQQHVSQALSNSPQPCPSSFIVQCLYVLPLLGSQYTEGFSHLLISSLRRSKTLDLVVRGSCETKHFATKLCLDILAGLVNHEERILIKLLEAFDIKLKDIAIAICGSQSNDCGLHKAKAYIERYIFDFIESHSYMTAVTLSERFSIPVSGESFLERMLQNNEFKAAEKWATFMGKPTLCVLVQKYIDMKKLKFAYEIIKKNDLKQEFPDFYHLYKESLLKKLAEKGCWDVAELRTNKNKRLLEYLVYLAMEAGYTEKVDELCERYSLEGFDRFAVPSSASFGSHYLDRNKLVLDGIVWVDKITDLLTATSYIEGCKIVGIDCEWKPNYEKGSMPNKVSIMQIASENRVFIFDLITLYETEPKVLDSCFSRILSSPSVLKLGYNLQCDLHQLSQSYGDLECFRHYEMLLDIQKLFNEHSGGLSGLAEKVLGAGLNKTRRNSNWEQRPLSPNQIEYAALDAAVLVHIFCRVRGQAHSADNTKEQAKVEWRSHIISHIGGEGRVNMS